MRQTSGEGLHYWPRRSARLIGIPAEEIEDQQNKSNGSINVDEEEEEDENKEEPQHEEENGVVVCETNHDDVDSKKEAEEPQDECKNCKQRTNKQQTKGQGRTLGTLLMESQRFMHYPSSRGSGSCRNGRSTYNSRDIRPPPHISPRIAPVEDKPEPAEEELAAPKLTPLPLIHDHPTVNQVQFSFEIVPSGTSWYQTFLRDEEFHRDSIRLPDDPPIGPSPFLLPYEMSLEAILKSNRTVRKNNSSRGRPRGAKKSVPLSFRPIISTRLQMQSAARQSQLAAAASSSARSSAIDKSDRRGGCQRHSRRKKPWFNMPRKSPRCHASTMAILCSKSDTEADAVASTTTAAGTTKTKVAATVIADESQLPPEEVPIKERIPPPDSYLVQVLEEMLTQGLEKRPVNPARKRGRPRKRPLPPNEQSNPATELVESSVTELLATPLDRIEDIVDEGILPDDSDHCLFSDDDLVYPPYPWTNDNRRDDPSSVTGLDHVSPEVFHDLDSHSGSRSSSVYETASEIGSTSTSTGTCDSRRKAWRSGGNNLRRKRRCNMTGWPRSKKRRPLPLNIIDVDDDLNLTGNLSCNDDEDEGPPNIMLSPIREEATLLVDGSSPNLSQQQPQTSPRSSSSAANNKSFVSKPFQFQRKTLRFVGKRILRPAAQRHAPQRLEYWPCFPTESSSGGGRRRKRKTS